LLKLHIEAGDMTRKKDYRVAAVTSSIEEEAGEELLAFIGARPQYKVQQNRRSALFKRC